jgi:phage tail sheath protein FI
MGDNNARANLLNEMHVVTIIHQDGYRVWGNRTCCSDKKWMFLSVRRTADMINDALMRCHLWAVDENITASYLESVTRGVNNFLRHLKSIGAIIGGECWADPEINTPDQIQLGRVTFDFDFTPPYPAERLTFRSRLVNNYLKEIL